MSGSERFCPFCHVFVFNKQQLTGAIHAFITESRALYSIEIKPSLKFRKAFGGILDLLLLSEFFFVCSFADMISRNHKPTLNN